MPKVLLSGATLPDTRMTIRGGLAVALYRPDEVDGLTALCRYAPKPPDSPMASVYRALKDPSLDLAAWADYQRDIREQDRYFRTLSAPRKPARAPRATEDDSNLPEEPLPDGPLGKLTVALELAQELWRAQDDDAAELGLVVLIAEPGTPEPTDLHLEGDAPVFAIRPGSLIGAFALPPLRVASFAVCLVLGGGVSTSARRSAMIDRLRKRAAGVDIPDIRALAADPTERAKLSTKPLAVLVHGLFATDKGTFKNLQSRLERDFNVVGFPHDTVSESIEANGRRLAQHLAVLKPQRVCCLAHSRGGLVVRSAAAQLAKDSARSNSTVRIARFATFGTPHGGAEMAESPGSMIALVALGSAAARDVRTKSVASLVDMLACFAEMGGFPGVLDLRPPSTQERWLWKLQDQEGLFPDTHAPVFAVGGNAVAARPPGLMKRIAMNMARRALGDRPSDSVVTIASSLPGLDHLSSKHALVNSDHFSYFEADQLSTHDQVVAFLKED